MSNLDWAERERWQKPEEIAVDITLSELESILCGLYRVVQTENGAKFLSRHCWRINTASLMLKDTAELLIKSGETA